MYCVQNTGLTSSTVHLTTTSKVGTSDRNPPSFFKSDLLHRQYIQRVTYCMVQSPSWAANWFAASQEIYLITYLIACLLTYLLHGAESFLSS